MHVFHKTVVLIKKLLLDIPRLCLGIRRRKWCDLGQNWRNLNIAEAAIEGVQASVDALKLLSGAWK